MTFLGIQNNLRIHDSSRLSYFRVRIVPLEIFIPRKLGAGFFFFFGRGGEVLVQGFLWVLIFSPI